MMVNRVPVLTLQAAVVAKVLSLRMMKR